MTNNTITVNKAIEMVATREWVAQKNGKASIKNAQVFGSWYGLDQYLNEVSTDTMREFKFHCRDKLTYAPATTNRKLAAVSKLITYATGLREFSFKWGVPKIEYEKENNQRKFVFTPQLESKLITTTALCGYGKLTELWICLIETGCRVSELLNLTWSNIEGDFLRLTDTKNGDERFVPIFDRVKQILERRRKENLIRPFPYSLTTVENNWRTIRKKMGMQGEKDFVIHSLRHTYITRLLRRNIGIEVVQKVAGHRDIRMTQRYNHPTKDDLRNSLKVTVNK
jgi:integrase